jgi:hypothetical protein
MTNLQPAGVPRKGRGFPVAGAWQIGGGRCCPGYHSPFEAAHAAADLSAELEQLEADGRNGGIGELSMTQADAAQAVDQNIGHGGEPHAQLIGRHGGGRGPICKQFELLADAVLGLAAGAVAR